MTDVMTSLFLGRHCLFYFSFVLLSETKIHIHMKTINACREMGLFFIITFSFFFSFFFSFLSTPCAAFSHVHHQSNENKPNSRTVIDVEGGPDSVSWVVQLSDLHFSVFHPERALDFRRLVGPTLSMINPSLVLITGDLTDGKSADLLTMKQDENEWVEYRSVMEDVIQKSGLDKKIFYDLRGNHDNFGVSTVGGMFDFFQKYSINADLRRSGNVHSVTLQHCRALTKAYEMNPFLHSAAYCLPVPLLLAHSIHKTKGAQIQ